ncbi:site-specific integrase [Vibrio sp. SCSIO 43133]|uniref:tyrosine-type recombinase/integrase n=1 Tax=Vibrio sp. SCSIO 43133 TaxID=2802577 RepID=UPI0020758369|nr:site-specific integrase [Vibrio sp. SCSIO 43133]USE00693.1 site-specific integrase [Vibrio sp. SCSIO 43133]
MALTDSKLKALNGKKHDKAPIKIADRDGLTVYHRKTGKLSFVYRYRYNGKPQDLTLGSYPVIGLAEARAEALECRKLLADGHDPKLMRQLAKTKILEAVTVKDALTYWLDNYAAKNRANHEKHRSQFEKHVFPFIGNLPLEKCETRHWVKVFDDITNGANHRAAPKASGYILQNAKQALKFCRNRQYAHSTALDDLNIADIGEHQNKKDRVLSWSELMDVWHWTQDIKSNWYYRNLVHLLIVFGCRTQELRLSKVDEWDLEEMIWTTPKANSKTGQEIKRPIPDLIKPHIEALIEQSKNGFILGELKRPEAVSSYGRALSKKLNHKEPWTLHDLRRTFTTVLNDMEIEPYVVEQLLGHALGGVMAVYNRSQHLEKKRVALDVWIAKLNETESQSNVVGLR